MIGLDGTVFVGSRDYTTMQLNGTLVALNGQTGEVLWTFPTELSCPPQASVSQDGTVFVSVAEDELCALSPDSGTVLWRQAVAVSCYRAPAIALDGTLYVENEKGGLTVLRAVDGSVRGTSTLGSAATAVMPDGSLLSVGGERVCLLDGDVQSLRWALPLTASSAAVGSDGMVYLSAYGGLLHALDGGNGEIKWKVRYVGGGFGPPILGSDGTLYAREGDSDLAAVDSETGVEKWKTSVGDPVRTIPVLGEAGVVFVGTMNGYLVAFDTDSGSELWRIRFEEEVFHSPALGSAGILYVSTADGVLHALSVGTSLANAPWPMAGKDPGHTRSTQLSGPPAILHEPSSQSAPAGGVALLGVMATGTGPLSYQWFKDGETVEPEAGISGVDEAVLRIGGVQEADAGNYSVIVSDGFSSVESASAELSLRPPVPGELFWWYPVNERYGGAPALGTDGTLYAGLDGRLRAFDSSSGFLEWETTLDHVPLSTPAVGGNGSVYVGTGSGTDAGAVVAVDGRTGAIQWGFPTEATVSSPAIGWDGTVYAAENWTGQRLYALEGSTGALRWVFWRDHEVLSPPSVGPEGTLFVSSRNALYALDPATGEVRWEVPGDFSQSSPAIAADGAVLMGSEEGNLYRYSGATGVTLWSFDPDLFDWPLGSPAIGGNGRVFVSRKFGALFAVDGSAGRVIWNSRTSNQLATSPAVGADGTLYAAIAALVAAFDGNTGQDLWEASTLGLITGGPVLSEQGVLFVSSEAGSVYALYVGTPPANSGWPMHRQNAQCTGAPPAAGAPHIRQAPADVVVSRSGVARFSVAANGAPPQSYQWLRDGEPLMDDLRTAGTRAANLAVGDVQSVDAASRYSVVVSNAWGTATSAEVQITLREPVAGELLWRAGTGNEAYVSPALGMENHVLAGVAGGRLLAFGLATGTLHQGHPVTLQGNGRPVVGTDGTVFVATTHGDLHALHPGTGEALWSEPLSPGVPPPDLLPALGSDGTVYVVSSSGSVFAVDPATGDVLWRYRIGSPTYFSPVCASDGTVFVGADDGFLHGLDGMTGVLKWRFNAQGKVRGSAALDPDGAVYFGSVDFRIYALNGLTGKKLWDHATGAAVASAPVLGPEGVLYAGSGDGGLYALDASTGTRLWEFDTGSEVWSSPAVGSDGVVYVGSANGVVHAVDSATGQERWRYETGGTIHASPLLTPDGILLVGSDDGYVYAFRTDGAPAESPWPMFGQNPRRTGGFTQPNEPSVIQEPASAEAALGGVVEFSVLVGGSAPLEYQWLKDGLPVGVRPGVRGVDRRTLVLGNLQAEDAGLYSVEVRNAHGEVTSTAATLTLRQAYSGEARWDLFAGAWFDSPPALGPDGTVYATANNGWCYAFDPLTGEILWAFDFDVPARSAPAIGEDNTVHLGSTGGGLLAVDGRNGTVRWRAVPSETMTAPAIGANGTLYSGSQGGTLHAFTGADGLVDWTYDRGSPITLTPVLGADDSLVACAASGVFAVGASDGKVRWETASQIRAVAPPAVGGDGTIYVCDSSYLHAIGAANGEVRWNYRSSYGPFRYVSPVVAADGTIFVTSYNSRVHALDPAGTVKWTSYAGQWLDGGAALSSDGLLYVGTIGFLGASSGSLVALQQSDGSPVWELPLGGAISAAPTIGPDGTLYVGSATGWMHAVFGSAGPAQSPWPMYQQNARHSGRTPPLPPSFDSIDRQEESLVLRWSGSSELQWSSELGGGWENVPEAASPFVVTPSGHQGFFRLRRQ